MAAARNIPLPGDAVVPIPDSGELRLGPGLVTQEGHVAATKAGVMKQNKSGSLMYKRS